MELKSICNLDSKITKYCGISPKEAQCLLYINKQINLTCQNIAKGLNLSISRCSRIISGLMKKNHLTSNFNLHDRRYHAINLTESGKVMLDKIQENIKICEKQIKNKLKPSETAEISRALDKLIAVIQN